MVTPPAAVAQATQASPTAAPSERRAAIEKKLAPRCGQPTDWTPDQKRAVAGFLEAHAGEWPLELLAGEWKRETEAIRICRGDAK